MTAPVVLVPPDLGQDDDGEPIEPVFDNWLDWYREVLSQWFTQDGDVKGGWCPQWRQHPLAAASVNALWRAWEVANIDPGASMATFLAHQCFPIMRELMVVEGGTFAGCTPSLHRDAAREQKIAVPLP